MPARNVTVDPTGVVVIEQGSDVVEVVRDEYVVEVVEGGEIGPAGPPGPPGPPGADAPAYTHTQTLLSAVWVVVHGLGRHPSVTVVDSGDSVVLPDILYVDDDELSILFGAPTSGKAYLN